MNIDYYEHTVACREYLPIEQSMREYIRFA